MEKRLFKMFPPPRRSPRLLAKHHWNGNYSTSMMDLGLPGAEKLLPDKNSRHEKVQSCCYEDISFSVNNQLKHEPKIKSKGSKINLKQSRVLKRMRDTTLTLRGIENVMPTPVKRVKSCVTKLPSDTPADAKVEPLKKKFTRVVSFARGFSPRISGRKKSDGDIIFQRSSSLRAPKSPDLSLGQQAAFPIRFKKRGSELWLDSVADLDEVDCWTPQQIKRQEAIYELYCGEVDLVEDIKLLQEVYFNPLTELKLVGQEDLESIFGNIRSLLPLHTDLVKRLEEVREENGSIHEIGEILLKWIPTLHPYIEYCAKQLEIKEILFQVSKDKQVSDFFQRCLEEPCSRKLDLWSFLDSPRGKLVKYPLLVTNIHKYTPKDHPDRTTLEQSIKELEGLIKDADHEAGVSKCSFYKEKLTFVEDPEYKKAFDEAKILVCNGCLRNKSGSKVQVFLFDTIFVCARITSRNGNKVYIVNTKPILVADMQVIDLGDGEVRLGGSFRTTLTKGSGARHAFRVSTKTTDNHSKSMVLQCNDKHDKKQWLNSFQSLLGTSALRKNEPLHTLKVIDSEDSTNNCLTIKSVPEGKSTSANDIREIPVLS